MKHKKPLPKLKKRHSTRDPHELEMDAKDMQEEMGKGSKMYEEQGDADSDNEGNRDKELADEYENSKYAKGGYIANPTEAQARSGYCVGAGCKGCGSSNCMAKGGEVDMDGDSDKDDELMDVVSSELMEAFEKKDKQGILDAIRAIVLSCK